MCLTRVVRRPWAALTAALIVVASSAAPAAGVGHPAPTFPSPVEELADGVFLGAEPGDLRTGAADGQSLVAEDPVSEDAAEPEPADDSTPAEDDLSRVDDEPPVDEERPADDAPASDDEAPASGGEATAEPTDPVDDDLTEPGAPAGDQPVVVVVPEAEPAMVDGKPGYLLPRAPGFSWLVDGSPADELVATGAARFLPADDGATDGGRYEVTAETGGMDVVIAAVAEEGHLLLVDGELGRIHYAVDLRMPVELVEPIPTDGAGQDDVFMVLEVPGQVVRDAEGAVVDPGEHPVVAEYVDGVAGVELSVAAAAGHRLEDDGARIETVPGAGGVWSVALTFTDWVPPQEENDSEPDEIADDAEPTPEFGLGEALSIELVTIDVGAPQADTDDEDSAEDVEEAAADPEPVEPAAAPPLEPPAEAEADPGAGAAQNTERLSDSGQEGLDLMVLLSLVFVGGAMLLMGTGRDLFS